jgi:hypothetical protein
MVQFELLRRRYLGPLVAFVIGLRALAALVWMGSVVPYQWDVSFPESAVVARAADVARGESSYHDWREWPHHFAPYGPLGYALPGSIAALFAEEPSFELVRRVGRLQSIASIVAILVFAALLARSMGGRGAWPWIAAAVALCWESLYGYVVSFRPDAPQVAFALAAVWIVSREKLTIREAITAMALISISFWFKAASIGPLLAVFMAIVWRLGWKTAAICAAEFLTFNALLFFTLETMTGGLFSLNVINSLNNGLSFENFINLSRQIGKTAWLIFALGGVSIFLNIRSRTASFASRIIALAALFSAIVTLALYSKTGADINYWLEPFVLFSVMAVALLARLWNHEFQNSRAAIGHECAFAGVLLPLVLYFSIPLLGGVRADLESSFRSWKPLDVTLRIREEAKVLSVIPYLALESRGEPAILDHYQYRVLASRGLLDTKPLLDRVRAGEFSAIVIEGTLQTPAENYYAPEFTEALQSGYAPAGKFGALTLLKPREGR